jgi:hypothetical protein
MLPVVALCAALLGAAGARAQGLVAPAPPPVSDRATAAQKPGAGWYRGNYITLDASEPTAGFRSRWTFERTPGNDIRLVLDEQRKTGAQWHADAGGGRPDAAAQPYLASARARRA